MSKEEKKLDQLIEKAQAKFHEKDVVAFIGPVQAGKTVVAALLKHTLSTSWIPKSKGKWEAVVSSGYDEINEIIRDMKKGTFPSPTPENEYPQLVIDVHSMVGKPTKIELALRDMSGENYSDLLQESFSSTEEQLIEILSGDGDYLAVAKKYVITIDCSMKADWDTDYAKVAPMIGSIRKIKQIIHNYDSDERIHNPIAIVFTKADRLDDNIKKLPVDLIKDYPELQSSLNINHDGNSLGFFKVHIDSKLETKKEAEERVIRDEEKLKKEFESKMKSLRNQIDTAIKQAVSAAEKKAREAGQPEDQIQTIIENTKKQTSEKYREQLEQEPPQLSDREKRLEPIWKVAEPFNYSVSEYSKLISWILEQSR